MREKITSLSSRAEFFLVIALSFGYYVFTSMAVLLRRVSRFDLTTGRAIRGIVIEALILAIVAWILRVRGRQWRRITHPISLKAILGGVALFLAYITAYWFLAAAVAVFVNVGTNLLGARIIPVAPFVLVAAFIVVNSFFEELIVSGYVITALSKQGAALSITASTLLRFLYHLYQGPVASLSILPLGLLFGAVYFRSRNVWPLIVAHTIVNLIAFWLAAR